MSMGTTEQGVCMYVWCSRGLLEIIPRRRWQKQGISAPALMITMRGAANIAVLFSLANKFLVTPSFCAA